MALAENCQNSPGAKYLSILCHCERESGDFRLVAVPHAGDEKPRDNDLYLFCSREYIAAYFFISSCTAPAASFNLIYIYTLLGKIEDRNFEILQPAYC
jgi:hypothetical protein